MSAPTTTNPPPPSFKMLTLDIHSYSKTKKRVPNGRWIRSNALVAGGHSWRISYYPNGISGYTAMSSVYLRMDDARDAVGDDVRVEFKFSLQELGGGPPRFVSSKFVGAFGGSKRKPGLGMSKFVSHEELEKSEFFELDSFTICCDFAVLLPPNGSAATVCSAGTPAVIAPPSSTGLHADLGSLLETKEGADMDFEVCGERFAAHKLVLAARSPVFKADFFGRAKEESTSYIRICDMNPEAFKALLHYMYTDTLPETMPFNSREEGAMLAEAGLALGRRPVRTQEPEVAD
ncbi:hypothetical protein EJB05_51685, partial [Eragrostis curvula]